MIISPIFYFVNTIFDKKIRVRNERGFLLLYYQLAPDSAGFSVESTEFLI